MRPQELLSAIVATSSVNRTLAFNAPADVSTWCGKPYMSRNQALNPGGQFQFPQPQPTPMLHVTIKPRYTIFLESDSYGSFIVDASISSIFGEPFKNVTYGERGTSTSHPFTTLAININDEETGTLLVSTTIPINSVSNLLLFSLSTLTARSDPYAISLYGTSIDGLQTYSASTFISVLPSRTDGGSAVKIDNLYGGLWVQNSFNEFSGWYPVFSNGYYADGSYIMKSLDNLNAYQDLGLNTISIVPDGGAPNQAYPIVQLAEYWDRMDELNLFNIYEFRFTFQNATALAEQVVMYQNRSSLLLWYTADEPDGWMYDLNSTKIAYDRLRALDPYHPVSLVLNCQNFFYEDYASGTDIVFEDAYPVGINATWSVSWNTPCNSTYGDCGCDNCEGEFSDVSRRLDDFTAYQAALDQPRKPIWAVLQAFGGSEYWDSIPSADETLVMYMLAVNHGAKGMTGWIYPSTNEINRSAGNLGRLLGQEPAIEFVFGANPTKIVVPGMALLDVAIWNTGKQVMIGIVNGEYVGSTAFVTIELPIKIETMDAVLYGQNGWNIVDGKLQKAGLKKLEVNILILNIST